MVIGSKMWGNREGGSKKGCLFTLLLVAVATYYGIGIGNHYVQYFRLLDEMRTQARLATNIDDAAIQRRLLVRLEQLDLPSEARRLTIRRTVRPREIVIRTSYPVTFELPFYEYVHTFNPEARAPL